MLDLKNLDIEFLLDKSGSMGTNRDCAGGKSRWEAAQETVLAIATGCAKFDPDGITVVPFASSHKVYESVTADKVAQVFAENDPSGGTNTAGVLKARFEAYQARKAAGKAKSTCMIVMTDGAPDDQQAVAKVIIDFTKTLQSDDEMAVQFIQVGKDANASKFLAFLDDELGKQGAKYDICDTVQLEDVESFSVEQLLEKSFAD